MNSTTFKTVSVRSRHATLALLLLFSSASAATAKAATITLSSTCTFAKAVTSINIQTTQSGCTRSGTYGSSDTVVVPNGTYNIGSPVDIQRSMTIHGGGKTTAYLQTTFSSYAYAINVANPSIVVKIDNLTLAAGFSNGDTGINVNGENDTNLNDNNLELSYVVVASFGNSGIYNQGGRILVQNTLIYLNSGAWGGGVLNVNGSNNDGSWVMGSFVAKYSAISINQASLGGGIYNTGKLDLRSTLMQQNYGADDGGAIYVNSIDELKSRASCNVRRDTASAAQSEIDDNVSDNGWGIISTVIPCTMTGTIGSGNSSPYCSPLAAGCPQ